MAKSKIISRVSESASTDASSKTTSDAGSIHSTLSAATTVKGSTTATKTKRSLLKFNPRPKCTAKDGSYFKKQAVHHEAIASDLSLRPAARVAEERSRW
ncbi:hypothetical protein PVAR5_0374 [Paecilomyces variotii No. 5]|uniref:Uncharacterized protein n=1 Tax=Byssochlamys spectabilis (strain No. 5 / NBRC 109023) TaxID=1356009 RepID=V5FT67_BYSSN|nr:hypothetical protein PVAR5_0374 [Paecilomyces variotii No. 5]